MIIAKHRDSFFSVEQFLIFEYPKIVLRRGMVQTCSVHTICSTYTLVGTVIHLVGTCVDNATVSFITVVFFITAVLFITLGVG